MTTYYEDQRELRERTLATMRAQQKERLDELVKFAGNTLHLAFMLDMPEATVKAWVNRGRISKLGAVNVEKNKTLAKHFSALYLRPDLAVSPTPSYKEMDGTRRELGPGVSFYHK